MPLSKNEIDSVEELEYDIGTDVAICADIGNGAVWELKKLNMPLFVDGL